ncbi:DUF11 domain-containing protein [Deinococcus aerius]|uniref:DUF11 domain-containing protein n=1 Tax=Deinococcus aerius TaxID=200253 RepID=A0A2I9DYL1_9DEIO|nr:DUF11 domain-containing protein [Deinococcus aerius]GBF05985.1 DUF11 domain-containing protein [Deinococcus aerius]
MSRISYQRVKNGLLRGGTAALALVGLGALQTAAAAALDCNTIYASVGTNAARAGVGSYLATLSTGGVLGNAVQLPASVDQTSTTNGGVSGRSVTAGFGVDPVNKRIYYVDGYGGTGYNTAKYARLYSYDGTTFTRLTVDASGAPVFSNPTTEHQAGVDEAGTLWATDWAAPSDVYQYSGGTVTRYLNAIAAPTAAGDATEWNSLQDGDMAFDGVFDGVGQGRMWFVSSTTTNIVIYMVTRTSATAFQAKKVASFAPTAGVISAAANWVTGAAFGPDGLLYISTSGSDLYKYNTVAGTLAVAKDGVAAVSGQSAITDLGSCSYPKPDLAVTKTHSGSFQVWQAGSYTLTVTNNGQFSTSLPILLKDALPSGMTFAGATSSDGSVTGPAAGTSGTVSLTFTPTTPIKPGESRTVTLTVNVAANATTSTNYVSVGGGGDSYSGGAAPTPGSTCTSHCASDPTTVLPPVPATISQAFSPASVALGGTSTLTFTVTNPNAGGALTALNFTDTLTGMSVASTTLGGTCASVTSNPALTVGATTLNLTIPSLAASANCTITVQVKGTQIGVNPNATSGVTSAQTPTPGATSNTANLTVTPLAPTVGKSFAPASVLQGTATQLTITVTNPNAAAATSFTLTDDIAGTTGVTGLTITAVSSDTCKGSGTVTTASGKYVLTGGTLPAAGCSIVLTVQVPSSAAVGSKTNTIVGSTVAGSINNQSWPTPANATASLTVVAAADLTVTKTGPAYAKPGTDVTYTITVKNNSTANSANNVTVTDTLPATMTFKTSSPAATASGQTLNWGAVPLAANGTLTYTVTVTLPDAATLEANPAARTLTNNVSASSANDPDTTNNAASATTNMVYSKLTKTVRNVTRNAAVGTGGSGSPGEVLEYCIAFGNYGGITLANYTVSDGVPPNTTYVTGSAGVTPAVTFPGITPSFNGAATTWNDGTTTRAVNGVVTANVGSLTSGTQGQMCFGATIR